MTRVVCRQVAPVVGALAANQELVCDTIAEATAAGAHVLVLPELVTSGYVFASQEEADGCAVAATDPLLAQWADAVVGDAVVVAGFAERGADGRLYNSAAAVDASGVLAIYRKVHLWDEERTFFAAGDALPPVVRTPHGLIGVAICYDLEFPELTRIVGLAGADLLALPTNWPWVPRPEGERSPEVVIGQGAARVNRMAIACCDRTGVERGQAWNEGTAIIDSAGWVVAEAGPGPGGAAAELDLTAGRDKTLTPGAHLFGDRRPELYGPVVAQRT